MRVSHVLGGKEAKVVGILETVGFIAEFVGILSPLLPGVLRTVIGNMRRRWREMIDGPYLAVSGGANMYDSSSEKVESRRSGGPKGRGGDKG